ncbi:MAG: uracil-DNA glycosylase [Deltaproteobacteria bacterium]|nr:uracil-DNA glycosylase [Deltaproteobacteria bacterium]
MDEARPDSREELRSLVRAFRRHLAALQESQRDFRAGKYTLRASHRDAGESQSAEDHVPMNVTTHVRTLDDVREDLGDCRRCHLHGTRNNLVFGDGDPHAALVFVGEAPGEQEDIQGRPFVGRAGQLLTDIIKAMNLTRTQVYICNILKCRPPGNRNPNPDEIALCEPFLIQQLEAIRPKVICALGTFAAKTLLKTETPISKLRGRFHMYQGIPLMPTFHPAYLLRNPAEKKQVWQDVKMIMEHL